MMQVVPLSVMMVVKVVPLSVMMMIGAKAKEKKVMMASTARTTVITILNIQNNSLPYLKPLICDPFIFGGKLRVFPNINNS